MWKAHAGHVIQQNTSNCDDDWETDPDFINDVTEEEQRWGSKTIEGSGRTGGNIDIHKLREQVTQDDANIKKRELDSGPKASYGYGGKFGVEKDRMDKAALGHDHLEKVEKHASQKDYASGFGGKFGVQTDRQDRSAVGFDYQGKVEKHESQKDYSTGFGGKFGVQTDRVDKSAMGWNYQHKLEQHESQKDYAKGFGGKHGLQTDRVDQCAFGWDHKEKIDKHCSQIDYTTGFGGKFGVQSDRQDKSALGWDHREKLSQHESQKDYSVGFGGKFGVQSDRQDSSAAGWEEVSKVEQHPSQVDMKKGFGGKFGLETDRVDKSAHSYGQVDKPTSNYEKVKPEIVSDKAKSLRNKFENLATAAEEESRQRTEEERKLRLSREKREKEEEKKKEEARQLRLKQENEEKSQKQEQEHETQPQPAIRKRLSSGLATEVTEEKVPVENSIETYQEVEQTVEHKLDEIPKTNETLSDDNVILHTANIAFVPEETVVEHCSPTDKEDYYEPTGVNAIALYDYQAAADDEISFDPDEIISNIEMIDEGWWRGECRGKLGLFPANYVQLQE